MKHLCETCFWGTVTINKVTRYRNYPYGKYESTSISTTCTYKNCYKRKRLIVISCRHYQNKNLTLEKYLLPRESYG